MAPKGYNTSFLHARAPPRALRTFLILHPSHPMHHAEVYKKPALPPQGLQAILMQIHEDLTSDELRPFKLIRDEGQKNEAMMMLGSIQQLKAVPSTSHSERL